MKVSELISRGEAFKLLGVTPGVDDAEIKRAFKRKARECHPDFNPEGEAEFLRLTQAYEIVSNGADVSDVFDLLNFINAEPRTSGRDVELTVHLTREEHVSGVVKKIQTPEWAGDNTLWVKIPPLFSVNSRLKISGKGEPGLEQESDGHLYLKVIPDNGEATFLD